MVAQGAHGDVPHPGRSNPTTSPTILSPLRLPISPPGRVEDMRCAPMGDCATEAPHLGVFHCNKRGCACRQLANSHYQFLITKTNLMTRCPCMYSRQHMGISAEVTEGRRFLSTTDTSERRRKKRFPIEQELRYKSLNGI